MKIMHMLCAGALLCAAASVSAQINVKNGDKIAFLGDSITQMGNYAAGYVNIVMDTLEANGIKAEKIPAGIGGNKSIQMLKRLDKDVIAKKPQIMTLSCGVNDVWHGKRGIPLEDYKKNITEIVDKAQQAGIQVYILTATMITENPAAPSNVKLAAYNDFLRTLAKEKNCVLVDLNADMQKELAALKAKYEGVKGVMLTLDGVHMNPLGNRMMARGILRAFGLTDDQIAKGEAQWMRKMFNHGFLRLPVSEYLKLADKAYAAKMSVPEYVIDLVKKDIASK